MRIISGTYKGKRLTAPKKLPVRPTTDFAKEALFNIFRTRIHFNEISVLDLFSGTGNICFEFASRGVEKLTAVDAHFGCVNYIRKISEELSFPITAVKSDVNKYLNTASQKFDIIFADPPYDFTTDQLESIVNGVFDNNLLEEDGTLVIEHFKQNDISHLKHFSEVRKYGGSVFSFFIQE